MRDLEKLKEINLYELATLYGLELNHKSTNEYCAPCPICGGTDRFVIHTDSNTWFCRQHEGHRGSGDVIEFVMLMENVDFKIACRKLESRNYSTFASVAKGTSLQAQIQAHRSYFDASYYGNMLDKNQDYMNQYSQQGKYLLSRGISLETAQAFKIGGSYAHGEKALAIPYYWNGELVGGKWRILEPQANKYHVWKGSNIRNGFGWHTHKQSETLFIVEGEINAMSLYEANSDIDVLSMGSENSFIHAEIAEKLTNYERVILWADSETGIDRWAQGIPNYERAFVTVAKNGIKWDANECLKRNKLDNVLYRILNGKLGMSKEFRIMQKYY